jgi:hypothetical protein
VYLPYPEYFENSWGLASLGWQGSFRPPPVPVDKQKARKIVLIKRHAWLKFLRPKIV